jgi:OOP family OmpA-OmpF porin
MSINLLQIAESTLVPIFLSKAGHLFGLNQGQGKSALANIFPVLLSGILNKAASPGGGAALYKAVTAPTVDANIVANLSSLLGNSNSVSNASTQGNKVLDFLFGDKAVGLAGQIASQTGAPAAGTQSLMALAAPALFGLLKSQITSSRMSPHDFISMLSGQSGFLEKSLPEKVLQWLGWGSVAGFIGSLGSKFGGALNGLSKVFESASSGKSPVTMAPAAKSGSAWKWLLPLALIGLGAVALKSCQKPATPPAAPEVTPAPVVAPAAVNDSLLSLALPSDKAYIDATVATEIEKEDLLKQLESAFGKDGYTANIKVDALTKPASWLAQLRDLFTFTKLPGAELFIKGTNVRLSGTLADPKLGLLDKLKALLTGMNVSASAFNADAAIMDANTKFADAIKALLASGTCDAGALVNALNLYVVNFASGSAAVPSADVVALKSASPVVAACAKDGSKFEIGGHTDNVGDATANLQLSEARAQALKALFVEAGVPAENISIKGYGDTSPVGNNYTEEGRFTNRRISYTKQ